MNFYNENDPKAAAWLRELIRCGHIAPGIVDERSIALINPSELHGYVQCHFFAGIGGWSFALRIAGWPDDRPVWTGSCPCQPFSQAGLGLGEKDPRHLWPQFYSLIAHCNPPVVFGEQVASKAGRNWLAGIRADLEKLGYAVGAADLCAASVGAPHIRQRLFWVADPDGGQSRQRALQPSGQYGQQPEDGGTPRGVGDAAGFGRFGATARAESARRSIAPRNGGLVNADSAGFEQQRGAVAVPEKHAPAKLPSDARGLVDSALPQGPRFGQLGVELHRPSAWSAFEIIGCADGKARRIEPGTFPLAHGVSGRVGLLRGYGNAIVPFLAAEFICASQEVTA